ncbi:SUKH-4 family immunity protein [Sabulibacter ruber]|uniref:SUKH-4 family immunity protein n=1 Tax=Sabulibacter ruber TaxID=2811901 RepID=UPI001A95B3B6|nr:SUKH-4 family immunity protein [Sabulibacter ruber]
MKSEEFLKKWKSLGSEHLVAEPNLQSSFDLGSVAFDFLFIIGMPSEFQELNFDYLQEKKLVTVNQMWELNDSDYDKYLAIGFNGAGDPIAINLETQEMLYLNHDNYFKEVFINSDLKKFAFSAIRINSFFDSFNKLFTDSLFNTEFSDEEFNKVLEDLKLIDSKVFEIPGSHWQNTLETYKWERDEERKKYNR